MESIYSNDQPVLNEEQDLFQRYNFSKRIAKTIINKSSDDCTVIGLYGAWGDGKTSVLNFIEDELNKEQTSIKCIKFNPWRYKGEEDLLTSFFLKITKSLSKSLYNDFEKVMKQVGVFGSIKMPWVPDIPAIAKHLSSVDIETLKDRVSEFLKKSNYSLVVIIDDIDRLDKQEIYAIMKLVKLTADFVKTTYILSFDDKMVASAIGERFSTGNIEAGYSFLEKIIQVPLRLPQIPLSALRRYCLHNIYSSLRKNRISISEEETIRFERIFEESIIPRLTTPRLAIRYSNSLSFSLPILYEEVNTVDFILVEALKIFYPVYYEYVKNNSDYFINYLFIGNNVKDNDQAEENGQIFFTKKLFDLTPNISEKDKDAVLSLLRHLFPIIEKYFNKQNHSGITSKKEWYTQKRVTSVEYFRRYFTYSLGDNQISDITISEFILALNSRSEDEVVSQIKNLVASSSADEFLTKISHIPRISDWNDCSKLILAMVKIHELLLDVQSDTSQENPSLRNRLTVYIFDRLRENENTATRYELAENIMKEAETFDLAYSINNELRRKFKDNEQLFESEEYNKLGAIIRNRALSENGETPLFQSIQKISQIQYLFNNWNIVDRSGLQTYVSDIINKDPEKIKYLIMAFTPEMINPYDGRSKKTNFEDGYFNFLDYLIDTTEVYNLILQHYGIEISQKPVEYVDDFGDGEQQNYDNVILQFLKCYDRKVENTKK